MMRTGVLTSSLMSQIFRNAITTSHPDLGRRVRGEVWIFILSSWRIKLFLVIKMHHLLIKLTALKVNKIATFIFTNLRRVPWSSGDRISCCQNIMIIPASAQLARRGAWWRICSGFLYNQESMITHHCLVCMLSVLSWLTEIVFQWYLRPDPHRQDEEESRAGAGQVEDVRH